MKQNIIDKFRKIHLDFHTPSWVGNIGKQFDPERFVDTLQKANVDNICVFAKCCHGMSYYPTRIGVRHPNLQFDLLGEMVRALRKAAIAVSIYYTVVWDDSIVDAHPGWAQRDREGNPRFGYGKLWRTVCVNSPYTEEVVLPQVKEIIDGYHPDEFWFDMLWVVDEECFCDYCRAKMLSMNLDPESRQDRVVFSDWTDENFIQRVTSYIRKCDPQIGVTYNNCVRVGARRKTPFMDVFEIESLPHAWGYWYFPLYSRYLRSFGIPLKGMTCRFHKFWGDFGSLKPVEQMQFEAATMLVQGAGCVIGDQLDPGGKLESSAYENIGRVFDFIEKREPWSKGWSPVTEIAVLADTEPGSISQGKPSPSLLGATKVLIESHEQFDVIDEEHEFDSYRLIVIADMQSPSKLLLAKLERYLSGGGKVILCDRSLAGAGSEWLGKNLGFRWRGRSSYTLDYIRIRDEKFRGRLPGIDMIVYDRFSLVEPITGIEVLADTIHPLEERTPLRYMSHLQASPGPKGEHPAVVARDGRMVYYAPPIWKSYFESGNPILRQLAANGIRYLLSDALIRTNAPGSAEMTVLRRDNLFVLHCVNYSPSRRGNHPEVIEEIRPLYGIEAELRLPDKPVRCCLIPDRKELPVEWDGTYARVVLPRVDIHAGIEFKL
jgi:hypothetical protein